MNKNTLFTTCMMALTMCFSTLTADLFDDFQQAQAKSRAADEAELKEHQEHIQALEKQLKESQDTTVAGPNSADSAATGGSASSTVVPPGAPSSPPERTDSSDSMF